MEKNSFYKSDSKNEISHLSTDEHDRPTIDLMIGDQEDQVVQKSVLEVEVYLEKGKGTTPRPTQATIRLLGGYVGKLKLEAVDASGNQIGWRYANISSDTCRLSLDRDEEPEFDVPLGVYTCSMTIVPKQTKKDDSRFDEFGIRNCSSSTEHVAVVEAGTYTINATIDTGWYQGVITAKKTLIITN